MWHPENWEKNPCIDCPNKQIDEWGYLCDWSCGKRSAWLNYEAGADKMRLGIYDNIRRSSWNNNYETIDVTFNMATFFEMFPEYLKAPYDQDEEDD